MATLDAGLVSRFPNLDADALKEIIDTDLPDSDISNFLNMAYYVTRPLVGELGACGGNSAEETIVKVLAAHYLTMYQQQPMRMSSGEWSVTYRGSASGLGLKASLYGQQALTMDCSGTLAKVTSSEKKASLRSVTYYDMNTDDDATPVI